MYCGLPANCITPAWPGQAVRPLVTLVDNSKSPEYNIFSLAASRERRTHALLALVPHMPCTKDPREMRMKGPSTVGRCVTA